MTTSDYNALQTITFHGRIGLQAPYAKSLSVTDVVRSKLYLKSLASNQHRPAFIIKMEMVIHMLNTP